MGEIIRKVTVSGLNVIPDEIGGVADVEVTGHTTTRAIVDTGASMTIVSVGVARRARIQTIRGLDKVIRFAGGHIKAPVGLAAVHIDAPGCDEPIVTTVAIHDTIAEPGGPQMIIGHDVLQRVQADIAERPKRQHIRCTAPAPRTNRPRRHR